MDRGEDFKYENMQSIVLHIDSTFRQGVSKGC